PWFLKLFLCHTSSYRPRLRPTSPVSDRPIPRRFAVFAVTPSNERLCSFRKRSSPYWRCKKRNRQVVEHLPIPKSSTVRYSHHVRSIRIVAKDSLRCNPHTRNDFRSLQQISQLQRRQPATGADAVQCTQHSA